MHKFLNSFLKEEDGVSIIEYGFMAAIIAVGAITGLVNLKDGIAKNIDNSKTSIENAS